MGAKHYLKYDVLEGALDRTCWTFDHYESVYLSYSAGKDSTVMLYLAAEEARRRGRRIGVLLVDLEGQFDMTMSHARRQRKG